jgi:hypothetical protein
MEIFLVQATFATGVKSEVKDFYRLVQAENEGEAKQKFQTQVVPEILRTRPHAIFLNGQVHHMIR